MDGVALVHEYAVLKTNSVLNMEWMTDAEKKRVISGVQRADELCREGLFTIDESMKFISEAMEWI